MAAQSRVLNVALSIGILALLSVAGCAGAQKAPDSGSGAGRGEVFGPSEAYGPPEGPAAPAEPAYGPEPIQLRPLVLVLGPGEARGFAHVGALRAIAEAKLPVAAIYGTEMGALVGALYAMNANLNRFEWGLLRFSDDVFVGGKSLIPNPFAKTSDGRKLEVALNKAFGNQDLNSSKIPLRIALRLKDQDKPISVSQGSAKDALRAAVANAGLFEPGSWEGHEADAAAKALPLLITEARATGRGSVIVIDPSGDAALANTPEFKDADLVLKPEVGAIGLREFNKRTEAAFRGKAEVNKHLAELRHLVGLPEQHRGARQ